MPFVVNPQNRHPLTAAAQWIPCDNCDEYWCSIHWLHVFECACPGYEELLFPENIETWRTNKSVGFDPYESFETKQ